jgi:hypothetical protein
MWPPPWKLSERIEQTLNRQSLERCPIDPRTHPAGSAPLALEDSAENGLKSKLQARNLPLAQHPSAERGKTVSPVM